VHFKAFANRPDSEVVAVERGSIMLCQSVAEAVFQGG